MLDIPKIIKAEALANRNITVQFSDGFQATFNFEQFYDYSGYFNFLLDVNKFLRLTIDSSGDYVYWVNDSGDRIEIDPVIMYSICKQQKIIIEGKVVFDPTLGKNAWL